jgi:hypothetical protein
MVSTEAGVRPEVVGAGLPPACRLAATAVSILDDGFLAAPAVEGAAVKEAGVEAEAGEAGTEPDCEEAEGEVVFAAEPAEAADADFGASTGWGWGVADAAPFESGLTAPSVSATGFCSAAAPEPDAAAVGCPAS